jgi:translation initiation factor 1
MPLTLLAAKAVQHGILPFWRVAQPILGLWLCRPTARRYWVCAGYLDVLFGILHRVANPPVIGAFLHLASGFFAVTLRRLQALAVSRRGALPLPEWGLAYPDPYEEKPVVKNASSLSALGGLVYSTDSGRHCPDCSQPVASCTCKQSQIPDGDGIARVRRESKGRGGKTVTTISGVPLALADLTALATALKKRCGCGGALKDGVIEIQGDHVELLLAELTARGFRAKKSGG